MLICTTVPLSISLVKNSFPLNQASSSSDRGSQVSLRPPVKVHPTARPTRKAAAAKAVSRVLGLLAIMVMRSFRPDLPAVMVVAQQKRSVSAGLVVTSRISARP